MIPKIEYADDIENGVLVSYYCTKYPIFVQFFLQSIGNDFNRNISQRERDIYTTII